MGTSQRTSKEKAESKEVMKEGELSYRAPSAESGNLSVRSLTHAEQNAEKARLQQLVQTFAQEAVNGIGCTLMRMENLQRVKTTYRIDKTLRNLMIMSPDNKRQEVVCPIGEILDIYSLAEDGRSCFPTEIIDMLRPEEHSLLLMIMHASGQNNAPRQFFLLETSEQSRDTFLECLRVLLFYTQSKVESASLSSVP